MGFGFGVLRLSAEQFWAMTPRELASAYQGMTGQSPQNTISRSSFVDLMSAFPDENMKG
jgi:uncharacterized phage protein (TIGR02216 family)